MNNVSPFAAPVQDVSPAHDLVGVHPETLDELIHELRQPLSVIESLAYYLELTSTDQSSCMHLQKIRFMLTKAHAILEKSSLLSAAGSVFPATAQSVHQGH